MVRIERIERIKMKIMTFNKENGYWNDDTPHATEATEHSPTGQAIVAINDIYKS